MEHWDDDEDPVPLADADRVRRGLGHRVQVRRAVRVDDPLRVAGGAARVTHCCRRTLFKDRPCRDGRRRREEVLVAEHVAESTGVPIPHHDEGLNRRQFVDHLGEQWDQHVIDDHHLVCSVVDHVAELLREEPDVQRVEDCAHRWDGEVGLHVRLVVPQERANPVAIVHSKPSEGSCELSSPESHLAERCSAVSVLFDCDDLGLRVDGLTERRDVADQQRRLLHGALEHVGPLVSPLGDVRDRTRDSSACADH